MNIGYEDDEDLDSELPSYTEEEKRKSWNQIFDLDFSCPLEEAVIQATFWELKLEQVKEVKEYGKNKMLWPWILFHKSLKFSHDFRILWLFWLVEVLNLIWISRRLTETRLPFDQGELGKNQTSSRKVLMGL